MKASDSREMLKLRLILRVDRCKVEGIFALLVVYIVTTIGEGLALEIESGFFTLELLRYFKTSPCRRP